MFTPILTALLTATLAVSAHPAAVSASFTELTSLISAEADLPTEQNVNLSGNALWRKFGWHQAEDLNLPDWAELMGEDGGFDTYKTLFMAATEEFPGITGKQEVGIYPGNTHLIELGDDHWRTVDLVRAGSIATYHLTLTNKLRRVVGDLSLSDGVWARVRPETIGYDMSRLPACGDTYLQVRAFIWREEAGLPVCRRAFKGLIHVTRHTKHEYFAPDAGYGTTYVEQPGDVVDIEVMTDFHDYSPQGSMSAQSGYYNGTADWFTHIKPGFLYKDGGYTDGGKLVMGGCPIYFLPATELNRVMSGVTSSLVSIDQGVRRKVAAGMDLKPHTFRAPISMAATFALGELYVVHRDPAMPDGTSAWSGECVGYTRGNYFEVPTAASPVTQAYLAKDESGKFVTDGCWEQGGGDFDGDDGCFLPHSRNGGAMLGFNDRPAEEQAALRAASGPLGRKGAGFKKSNYADGRERWMYQRMAAVELGMLDFRAGKLIDLGQRLEAAALKPLIQTAVDRQKRHLKYAVDIFALPKLRGLYARQLLSRIKRPDSAEVEDRTHWHHAWALTRSKVMSARTIIEGRELVGMDEEGRDVYAPLIMQPAMRAAMLPVAQWVVATWEAINRVVGQQDDTPGFPRANNFPVKGINAWKAEQLAVLGLDPEKEASMQEFEAVIKRLRDARLSRFSRPLEFLAARELAGLGDETQHEYSLHVRDASTWVKLAPAADIEAVFSGADFGPKFARIQDLPGVAVVGRGRDFEVANSAVAAEREMVNLRPLLLAGQTCEPGTVRIARDGEFLELRLSGVPVSRIRGRFASGVDRLYREMARLVRPSVRLDLSALADVDAPAEFASGAFEPEMMDMGAYDSWVPEDEMFADADVVDSAVAGIELSTIWEQANLPGNNPEAIVFLYRSELLAAGLI